MKKIALISTLFFLAANVSVAASIQAVRDGTPVVKHSTSGAVYTTIAYPIRVTSVNSDSGGPDLSQDIVLMSIGQVNDPVINSPCTVSQIGQVALYGGQVSNITIAVMAPASDQNADCSSAINLLLNSSSVKLTFQSAMLASGWGVDVAPLALFISNP